jgi:hypothetical protein
MVIPSREASKVTSSSIIGSAVAQSWSFFSKKKKELGTPHLTPDSISYVWAGV